MPEEKDPFAAPISKRRPLLGVTILLVEDSRFCSEAVRLMSLRSGARLRRADCVESARRHLAMYRPDLVMVDLGLPDGSGLDLIAEVSSHGGPCILGMSGDVGADTRARVKEAGASGFLAKPVGNIKYFQQIIEACLDGQSNAPGFSPQAVDQGPELDQQALFDDLDHVRDILEQALPEGDTGRMRYCAQFVTSVAQTARDVELMEGAAQFFQRMDVGGPGTRSGQEVLKILKSRLDPANEVLTGTRKVAHAG